MTSQADFLRQEYISRINRVIDYIDANLDRTFTLQELADVACFSRFHFHRIFSSLVRETLGDYIRRMRLQRAASFLVIHPRDSVTTVCLDCGFSSPSVFARVFKERFGMSATEWRDGGWRESKQGKAESKGGQADSKDGEAAGGDLTYPQWHKPEMRRMGMSTLKYDVELKELPALHVAYARHIGPYNEVGEAFGRLMKWAGPRGLLRSPQTKRLAVYRDDTKSTETEKLRSDACITVPEGTKVDGEIGLMTIPGGKFAVGRFEIAITQFGEAWDALIGEWLPSSGWQSDDRMCYEVYLNDHDQHPDKKFIIDICEPVRPL
jgi:AraC family transcriptional regulator